MSLILYKKYIITLLFFSMAALSYAQRYPKQISRDNLPRKVIDTMPSGIENTNIVLYSNNTWEYIHKDASVALTSPVFKTNWDTTQIFAYKELAYKDLPDIIELPLVDDIKKFHSPIKGNVFSKYGPRRRANHNGADVPLKIGEPIYATFDGKIRYAKYNSGGFGYLVIIRHTNGLETWSAHLSKINVEVNDYVKAGQIIGFGGNTGRSRGSHLHFEMRYKDQTFDPEFLIDFDNGLLRYQVFSLERSFFNIHSRASEILEEEDYEYTLSGSMFANADDSVAVRAASQQVADNKQNTTQLSESNAVYHTVKNGDMLSKIAPKYGVSIDQICRLNNIKKTTTLQLKQVLRVK